MTMSTIEKPTYDMSGYAKGADVSWLTEMKAAGYKFYDQQGKSMECMTLLRVRNELYSLKSF